MSDVKRYDLKIVNRYAGDGTGDIETIADIVQGPRGRYVKFIDYEDLAAENERLLKAGQTLQADYSSYRREVEHKQGYYDALAARVAELERDAAVAGDLAALVVRLARALRKVAPGNDLADKALDYLQRKGLQGSPLRDSHPQPEGIDSEGGSCD